MNIAWGAGWQKTRLKKSRFSMAAVRARVARRVFALSGGDTEDQLPFNKNSLLWRMPAFIWLLCAQLAVQPAPMLAQTEAPTQLNIVIVEGEGAVNNLRQRVVREPIVRVEDQNHKPVAGVLVTFLLPGNGAGGTFANGANLLTVPTDASGQAAARGLKANNASGQYQINVTASLGNLKATAVITQTNAAGGGMSAGAKTAIALAVAGALAVGLAVGLTRGGGSKPTTGLTPGSPSVGSPH